MRDSDFRIISGTEIAAIFRKDYHLVLRVATHPVVLAFFGIPLDQYFTDSALIPFITLTGQPVLQFYYFIESFLFDRLGNIVGIPSGSQRSGSFTIIKHVAEVVLAIFHQFERIPVITIGFGTKTSNEI